VRAPSHTARQTTRTDGASTLKRDNRRAGLKDEEYISMRVAMIGAGYVGLVSGACFDDFGHQVTCIEKEQKRVAALNSGEMPIFEPGLADLVEANALWNVRYQVFFHAGCAAARSSGLHFQ
jgi:hypothetical protein